VPSGGDEAGAGPPEAPPSYPNFAGKHAARPIVTPADMLAWRRRQALAASPGDEEATADGPTAAVLTYQPSLLRSLLAEEPGERWQVAGSLGQVHRLERTDGRVAVVGGFGFGAPVATIVLENLVALGVRRFVSMGTAGGLQAGQAFGDVVVCTAAVRDEGVSHHYLPPARWARPDPSLTDGLGEALSGLGVTATSGTAWTIDTPYMETDAEVRHYRDLGVACVEMEAAALFSVGARRGVPVASAFALSDQVTPDAWVPGFAAPELATSLAVIFAAAVRCLDRPAPDQRVRRP
jgi:uridine phosphorylase